MTDQNTQHTPRNTQWVFVHGAGGSSAFWDLVRPAFPGASRPTRGSERTHVPPRPAPARLASRPSRT